MTTSVLIVDDDPTQRRIMETVLSKLGYRTQTASGGEEAIKILGGTEPLEHNVVLLDLAMPGVDGLTVIDTVRKTRPELPFIVLTAHGGVDTVVKAMRAGACDFIVKPASPERLDVSLQNAIKVNTLAGEVSRLSRKISGRLEFADLVGASDALQAAVHMAQRAAASNVPILIEGESGVGKEMFARAIQGTSDRAGTPFVTVNCGAIPENLVESILFGHEKGAFTGATEKHIGKFKEASGGTLFLDEIGELRLDMQVKLLRALQEGEIDPVGSSKPVKVDIRLISATNRDLQSLVRESQFREDLYYRLSVFPITIPPLRARREDIRPLVDHFVTRISASEGKKIVGVTDEAMGLLESYDWPGNVRQLENTIFRAVILANGERLDVVDFPQIAQIAGVAVAPSAAPPALTASQGYMGGVVSRPGPESAIIRAVQDDQIPGEAIRAVDEAGAVRTLEDVEADMIRFALSKYEGRMSEVARRLGIGRSTLYRKVTDLGLDDDFKSD
jgi:DNA-binding NtrC family response regulator